MNYDWYKTLQEIESNSSTLKKQEILKDYLTGKTEQDTLVQLLRLQNEFRINSYISDIDKLEKGFKKKLFEIASNSELTGKLNFIIDELYNDLKGSVRYKKEQWKSKLLEIAGACSETQQFKYISECITKTLAVGLSTAGFNKVVLQLGTIQPIEEFEVMLASKVQDSKVDLNNCYASIKKDGVNCTYFEGKFYTRNGRDIVIPHLEMELEQYKDKYVLFGELVSTTRQASAGIVNSALKLGLASDLPVDTLQIYVFDILPVEMYKAKQENNIPFQQRIELTKDILETDFVKILEHWKQTDENEVYRLNDYYYNQGEEGIICNKPDGHYEWKRSKSRAKIKAELDGEFIITGYSIHSKQDNWIGALSVVSQCGTITSDVGSGMTEEDRINLFNDKENLTGKIVTLRYNSIVTDKKDSTKKSLFLPIFKGIRMDKNIADVFI